MEITHEIAEFSARSLSENIARAKMLTFGRGIELDSLGTRRDGETDSDFRNRLLPGYVDPVAMTVTPLRAAKGSKMIGFDLAAAGSDRTVIAAKQPYHGTITTASMPISRCAAASEIWSCTIGPHTFFRNANHGSSYGEFLQESRDQVLVWGHDRANLSDAPGLRAMATKSVKPTPDPVLSIAGEQGTAAEFAEALQLVRAKNAPAAKETPRGLLCVRGFDHRLGAWGN